MGHVNKTDKLDASGLTTLLRLGSLPSVWLPPAELRDQRELPPRDLRDSQPKGDSSLVLATQRTVSMRSDKWIEDSCIRAMSPRDRFADRYAIAGAALMFALTWPIDLPGSGQLPFFSAC